MLNFEEEENNKIINLEEYRQLKEEILRFNENFFDEFNNFIEFSDEDITKMLSKKDIKKNL